MNRGAIARAALLVTVFTLISRVLGFLREWVLAREFGASAAADVFSTGLMLVNSVAAVLAYATVTVIIPAIERERQTADERSAWRLVWTVGTWVTLALVMIGSVVSIWPSLVVNPFGLDPQRSAMLTDLVRIMAPALALQGITGLLTAVLQAQHKFLGPAFVGIAFNLGIILALVIFGGVYAAAWGVVAGAVAQVAFQLPQLVGAIRESGVFRAQFRHPRLTLVLASAAPVTAVSVLQQLNSFSDKYFAASLPAGKIAALNWAHFVGSLPRTTFLMPLLAPLFPVIARMAAQQRHDDTVSAFRRAAGVLGLVSLPLSAFMLLYGHELAQIMFGHGRCDAACVTDISGPLRYLALGTWAAFLGYLLNRTLSAMNAQRKIFVSMSTSVIVTIAIDIVLIDPMGISGLALASTIGVFTSTTLSLIQIRGVLPNIGISRLADQQGRLVVAAACALAAAWAANGILSTQNRAIGALVAPLVVKTAIGVVVFGMVARLLIPEVVREATGAARSIVRRRPAQRDR